MGGGESWKSTHFRCILSFFHYSVSHCSSPEFDLQCLPSPVTFKTPSVCALIK